MIAWYLCPYEVKPKTGGTPYRQAAICRYIPTVPNADHATFSEVEIQGDHALVKVDAPPALHTTIGADPEFLTLPDPSDKQTDLSKDTALQTKLESLGFTKQALSVSTDTKALYDLLASGRAKSIDSLVSEVDKTKG